MEQAHFNVILKGLEPFLEAQQFKAEPGCAGVFRGQDKRIKVEYNEATHMVELFLASEQTDGEDEPDWKVLSSWLFDQTHSERDAQAIAIDFEESLSVALGVSKQRFVQGADQVALPSRAKAGDTPGIEAFTQKYLSMFPDLKEAYKAHVALYGDFLWATFYREDALPALRHLLESKETKKLTKLFGMFEQMFIEADNQVSDLIVCLLVGGMFGDDMAAFEEAAKAYMEECKYIKAAGRHMVWQIRRDKKLKELLS